MRYLWVLIFAVFLVGCSSEYKSTSPFTSDWKKDAEERRIIRLVGNALNNKHNGFVGVYDSLRDITLWDMAKDEDVDKVETKLNALMNYLELEYVIHQKPFIRKRRNK